MPHALAEALPGVILVMLVVLLMVVMLLALTTMIVLLAMTTDSPVHVELDLARHVEVDDVLDGGEIQALCRHVCRHQHILAPRFELRDCFVSLLLRLAAVHGNGTHALQQQVFMHIIHVFLILGKDQHGRRRLLQRRQQVHDFGFGLHVLDLLHDV